MGLGRGQEGKGRANWGSSRLTAARQRRLQAWDLAGNGDQQCRASLQGRLEVAVGRVCWPCLGHVPLARRRCLQRTPQLAGHSNFSSVGLQDDPTRPVRPPFLPPAALPLASPSLCPPAPHNLPPSTGRLTLGGWQNEMLQNNQRNKCVGVAYRLCAQVRECVLPDGGPPQWRGAAARHSSRGMPPLLGPAAAHCLVAAR